MAADGVSFAISLGLNFAFLFLIYFLFALLRDAAPTKKFYAPRRYMRDPKGIGVSSSPQPSPVRGGGVPPPPSSAPSSSGKRPKRLPTGWFSWIGVVHRATQEDVIGVAGMDAAVYLAFLKLFKELFIFATFWSLATVLPTNLVGTEVNKLKASGVLVPNEFTYWIPEGTSATTPNKRSSLFGAGDAAFPEFYEKNPPPAPVGVKWWKYKEGVPPLPPPPPGFGWRRDDSNAPTAYDVSNLDRLTMSNVPRGSPTLLVHAAAAWAVTFYAFRLLWGYCTLAVSLRIRHLTTTPRGAETHSVLVTDVPGVEAGTFARRLDETLFRVLPGPVKSFLKRLVTTTFDLIETGVAATAGRVADAVIVGDADVLAAPRPGIAGVREAWRRSEAGGGTGAGRSSTTGGAKAAAAAAPAAAVPTTIPEEEEGGGGSKKEKEGEGAPTSSSSPPAPAAPRYLLASRRPPPERYYDVIDLEAGRAEEAERQREAAASSAQALAAANKAAAAVAASAQERRATGTGASQAATAAAAAASTSAAARSNDGENNNDNDSDDDLSSLPTALRLLSFSPSQQQKKSAEKKNQNKERAPGSAISARRLFPSSDPRPPSAAAAPSTSSSASSPQHDVVAAAAAASAAATAAASEPQPLRGYLATLPKGPPPAANRPPVDASAYVAKTEITAWTKAAAFLSGGVGGGGDSNDNTNSSSSPSRHSPHELVESEFRQLFPGQVHSVSVVMHSRRLNAAHKEYAKRYRALTDLCDDYTSKLRRHIEIKKRIRVSVLPAKYGEWGRATLLGGEKGGGRGTTTKDESSFSRATEPGDDGGSAPSSEQLRKKKKASASSLKTIRVDALFFNVARLTELARTITSLQADGAKNIAAATGSGVGPWIPASQTVLRPEPAAFVTFKTRRAAVLAAAALLHHDASAWHAQPAPGPREVLWDNLRLRAWERSLRAVFSWTALVAFSLAFLIPVAAIQTFLELPALANVKGLQTFITFPVVQSIIQCILPPLFLNVALLPVPWLIGRLSSLKGLPSRSAVDFAVVEQYFTFLVITVFFGSFAFGSVLNQLTMWARHPAQALTILGTAAPLTSIFFLNYVQFNALAAAPFALLRIFPLVLFALKSRAASTERAKARLWQDQFATFGPLLPRHSLVGLVGIVFAPINPLVPLMCTLYFLMASITEKYNMLYVRRERYQSGGLLWPRGADQVMVSLVVGQGVLAFLLFVKGAPWAGGCVLPLLPTTLLFRYAATQLVDRPFSVLSLRAAVDLDAADAADAAAEAAEQGLLPLSSPSSSSSPIPVALGSSSTSTVTSTAPAAASTLYRQPAMEFDARAHEALLAEARHIDASLRAEDELRRELADYNRFGIHTSSNSDGNPNAPRLLGAAAQGVWRPRRGKAYGVDVEM